jgi:hypothetical protein
VAGSPAVGQEAGPPELQEHRGALLSVPYTRQLAGRCGRCLRLDAADTVCASYWIARERPRTSALCSPRTACTRPMSLSELRRGSPCQVDGQCLALTSGHGCCSSWWRRSRSGRPGSEPGFLPASARPAGHDYPARRGASRSLGHHARSQYPEPSVAVAERINGIRLRRCRSDTRSCEQ